MIRQAVMQICFGFLSRRPVVVEPHEVQVSSDTGILPIRQFDDQIGLTERFIACLNGPRDLDQVRHTLDEMVRQRIYGILAGYEDCNDHDTLRGDPVLKMVSGKKPKDDDLASQPTLSRFENGVDIPSLWRLHDFFINDFIRVLENAFHHFGGVPKTLVPDNLKAAVIKADWFDPDLNPKIQEFCRHYDTVILPTKPRMARHKGKVEAGVKFVQSNALKGRTFTTLADQSRFLLDWEASVADTRIHGTTRKQVARVFQDVERAAVLPLPVERFRFFHERQRLTAPGPVARSRWSEV